MTIRYQLNRMLASPKLIPILGIMAVLSLLMSTYVVVRFAQSQTQRERDRVATDIAGCERGNVLRGQVYDLAVATEEMVDGILESIFARVNETRATELRGDLAPTFDRYEQVINSIELADCSAITRPGENP